MNSQETFKVELISFFKLLKHGVCCDKWCFWSMISLLNVLWAITCPIFYSSRLIEKELRLHQSLFRRKYCVHRWN